MKYTQANNVDSEFTESFLTKYMSLGFGNLPKKEIDILVFGLITKLGYIDGKDYYSIAKELMIEEKKVKRYILDNSLRNDKTDTVTDSIMNIRKAIFDNSTILPEFNDNYITFGIVDPIERRDFIYVLRCVGYSFDENLNPERITVPIYAFMAVFCRYDDNLYFNFKRLARERLETDSDREKAFNDSKPLIERISNGLKNVAEPINSITAIAGLFGLI